MNALLTVVEVAERLRMEPWPVMCMIEDGSLPAFRPARTWLIRESDLDRYVSRSLAARGSLSVTVSQVDRGSGVVHQGPPLIGGRVLVAVKDAAQYLSITEWSVYKMLDEGELEGRYQGRRRYVLVESIIKYLSALSPHPPD